MSIFFKLFILFILFTVVPVAELALLMQVGAIIGTVETVVLVIATALIGAWLVRLDGLGVIRHFQRSAAKGTFPANDQVLLAREAYNG